MVISINTINRLKEASAPFVNAGLISKDELIQLFTLAKKCQLDECKTERLMLITRANAAKILNISQRGLDRLIRQKAIPCVKVGKRSVRLDQRRIEKFIEENTEISNA